MGFVKYMSGIMVENPLPVGGFLYELSLRGMCGMLKFPRMYVAGVQFVILSIFAIIAEKSSRNSGASDLWSGLLGCL